MLRGGAALGVNGYQGKLRIAARPMAIRRCARYSLPDEPAGIGLVAKSGCVVRGGRRVTARPRFRDLPRWQRALLGGIWGLLALVLLTPLIVTVETAYPYTVGKAGYVRSLVALAFALWVPLALSNEAYRPPRSWLLVLLALGFVVALLAAAFGINLQRSLWSTYERMQGVVNSAHWLALALVVVSVVRRDLEWRVLFGLNVAVGVAVAVLAIGRHHGVPLPYLGDVAERSWQIAATFGNSTQLGNYALLNGFLAAGLAAWTFSSVPSATSERRIRWIAGLCWTVAACLNFWAMALSGALGAFVAFGGAVGAVAIACFLFGRTGAVRRAGAGLTGLVAVAGIGLAALFFTDNTLTSDSENPLLRRLSYASFEGRTTQTRLAAWEAAFKGFADRPVLGWGPDNYLTPYGRHAHGIAATYAAHDYAHNQLVEEVVTKGAVGGATYVATWIVTFLVVLAAVKGRRGNDPPAGQDQALPLFVGAALLAEVAFKQTSFPGITDSLLYVLLVSYVIFLEHEMHTPGRVPRSTRWQLAVETWLRRRTVRVTVCVATVVACAGGLYSNVAIHAGATALLAYSRPGAPLSTLDRAIDAFPPMANYPRRLFLDDLANNWIGLRMRRGMEAARMLVRADIEAQAAEQLEPDNWVVIHSLARLYEVVARTEPEYRPKAERYWQRAKELAPNIEIVVVGR